MRSPPYFFKGLDYVLLMDDPPRRRITNTSSPARIVPNAIVRRIERRRPRASHRAAAQRATAGPEPAAEELQDLGQILGGLELISLHDLDAAGVGTELLCDVAHDRHPLPSWITSGCRSSTTAPSSVLNAPTSSSRTLISCVCARV